MRCLKNRNHSRYTTVCLECLETINNQPVEPNLEKLEPELRALFVSLRAATREVAGCWFAPQTRFKLRDRTIRAENLYYAFFKGDINNEILKTLCNNKDCVNPSHKKSRLEKPKLNKLVTSGFNRKRTDFTKIPDAQWLREA